MANPLKELLEPPKVVMVKKALPNCPVGRLFKLTVDGNHYYHSMTDEEAISGKLKAYIFSVKEVTLNSEFFFLGDIEEDGYLQSLGKSFQTGQLSADDIAEFRKKFKNMNDV